MDANDENGIKLIALMFYMLSSMQSMDVESQKVLYENLWDLYDSVELEVAQ